jgi:hypothetical protein
MSIRKRGRKPPSISQSLRQLVDAGLIVKQGGKYYADNRGTRMIEAWTTKHPTEADDFLRGHLLFCLTTGGTTDAIDTSYVALNALLNHPAGTPCTIDPESIDDELNRAFEAIMRKRNPLWQG